MGYKRTIILLALVVKTQTGCALPLTMSALDWPITTNKSINFLPPIANPLFIYTPEDSVTVYSYYTNVSYDPQNASQGITHVSGTGPTNGLSSGPSYLSAQPNVNNVIYEANTAYIGTDGWQYWTHNSRNLVATNSVQMLVYNTNFGTSTCGTTNYTGQFVGLSFPPLAGTNYFVSVYSDSGTCDFSNLFYFNNVASSWTQIPTGLEVPCQFNGTNEILIFQNLCSNMNMCISVMASNSPCTMIPPNDLYLTVITNSQNTFSLPGSGPTYVISANPTNGYLTNLNGATGQVTYVETNSSAIVDYFIYCTSNSTTCMSCAPVNINIIPSTEVTCGQCFNTPIVGGGVVTGDIYFNTGIPNENVCISYTNASCAKTTNCDITDSHGNASFFVSMCPGDTNYCIVELQGCTNICTFNDAYITGVQTNAGAENFNGLFLVDLDVSSPGQFVLTNTVVGGSGGWTTMYYYPYGTFNVSLNVTQYAILLETGLANPVLYTTSPADCVHDILTNWSLTPYGSNFYTLPLTSVISNIPPTLQCTNICP